MRERFIAYVTKYALTAGIEEVEVEDCFDIDQNMVKAVHGRFLTSFFEGDWHRSREEAVARAEQMRKKKISALRSSLAKFEGMQFS
jgi:hypothetical protein